jgi:hypothetical protein
MTPWRCHSCLLVSRLVWYANDTTHTLTLRPFHLPPFSQHQTVQGNEQTASPTWDQLIASGHSRGSFPPTPLLWRQRAWVSAVEKYVRPGHLVRSPIVVLEEPALVVISFADPFEIHGGTPMSSPDLGYDSRGGILCPVQHGLLGGGGGNFHCTMVRRVGVPLVFRLPESLRDA